MPGVALLAADSDFGAGVPADELEAARAAVVLPRIDVPAGRWRLPERGSWAPPVAGVVLLSGLLARDVALGERIATQLIGPGDVFDPWARPDELLPCVVTWTVHEPAALAVLDARFAAAGRRWPSLGVEVQRRFAERADRLASQLASLHLSSVDLRVLALLWQLAERFGRVGHGGVVLPLKLTHQLLGQLVGAQRSTVTLAIGQLTERGHLERLPDGAWRLSAESRELLRPADAEAA
jgi:CRP-like cAMP-binding protein